MTLTITGNGSPKQLAWIANMIETKLWQGTPHAEHVQAIADGAPVRSARALIDYLKPLPTARPANNDPVTDAGMYRKNGVIYKVQRAVHGSGNLYAKELIPPAEHGERAEFVYARGVIGKLTSADKLTLEEAKQFGALYGSCCVCGRVLTDESSIESGIGPVCASKF